MIATNFFSNISILAYFQQHWEELCYLWADMYLQQPAGNAFFSLDWYTKHCSNSRLVHLLLFKF